MEELKQMRELIDRFEEKTRAMFDKPTPTHYNTSSIDAKCSTAKIVVPKPKKIDHSMLVGSRVLCEFSETDGRWYGGFLVGADKCIRYADNAGDWWSHIRVAHDYIHAHTGTEQPIPDGYLVEMQVYDRSNDLKKCLSGTVESSRVIWEDVYLAAFRVVGIAEGWEL